MHFAHVDTGTLSGIVTAVLLVVFLAVVAWSWSPRRRRSFDDTARLPLEEDDGPPRALPAREQRR
jgi:cytochrome c oxidase cbb3-type subunit 4